MIIAIDGYASSGKSAIAKNFAKKIDMYLLNTGMIFRAIAYFLHQNKIGVENEIEIEKMLSVTNIDVQMENKNQIVLINGVNYGDEIFSAEAGMLASKYSALQCVRNVVLKIQHKLAEKHDMIVEGRDIGTEVFPNAEYKFFVTASLDVRAERRQQDFLKNNEIKTLQEVKEMLAKRDYDDENRAISPLKKANDAYLLDTSNQTLEESVATVLDIIKQ